MSYSHTIFIGRLTADPELKSIGTSGVPVVSFTIAVDRKYQADKTNKVADFHQIVAWRNQAQFIARYFRKGDWICVDGELQNRSYTANDGNKRYVTELIVNNVSFVGDRRTSAPANASAGVASTATDAPDSTDSFDPTDTEDYPTYGDDLPF